jgi:anti-sigma-K factor RskA
MIGDYPNKGWRMWIVVAGIVVVALVGFAMLFALRGA